jgi:hypothetical protein
MTADIAAHLLTLRNSCICEHVGAQGTPNECESCRIQKEAADEIERLRGLIAELLPFARADAESGAAVIHWPGGHNCEPLCDDCQWHEDSLLLLERIRSGEFDPMPEDLHTAALEAYRNGTIDIAPKTRRSPNEGDEEA